MPLGACVGGPGDPGWEVRNRTGGGDPDFARFPAHGLGEAAVDECHARSCATLYCVSIVLHADGCYLNNASGVVAPYSRRDTLIAFVRRSPEASKTDDFVAGRLERASAETHSIVFERVSEVMNFPESPRVDPSSWSFPSGEAGSANTTMVLAGPAGKLLGSTDGGPRGGRPGSALRALEYPSRSTRRATWARSQTKATPARRSSATAYRMGGWERSCRGLL
eukprot:SAG11_NODE_2336_length_3502_cov_6.183368_5_plen_222_part_00